MEPKRVGMYAWGGPGTIRLLQTKYRRPKIDRKSFLNLYEPETLDRFQSLFGVTDMWVTYSWGFSDHTERVDRNFLRQRLENFHARHIKTHAYVQGTNLVTSEFENKDIFCLDARGRRLPYSRGRSFTCPNNPRAVSIIEQRVLAAARENTSGVFVDNVLFGLPPFYYTEDLMSFSGCSCIYCQKAFRQQFGYALPKRTKNTHQVVHDTLRFRSETLRQLVERLADIAHAEQKTFGINLYDPFWHTAPIYFGYHFDTLAPLLDYYLFENHHLPSGHLSNQHLIPLLRETDKNVFVVSYKQGIGFESAYGQDDIDALWTEAHHLGYTPCLKATEFTSHGIWHALRTQQLKPPHIREAWELSPESQTIALATNTRWFRRWFLQLLDHIYPTLARRYNNIHWLFRLINATGAYQNTVHRPRIHSLDQLDLPGE